MLKSPVWATIWKRMVYYYKCSVKYKKKKIRPGFDLG